MASPSLVLKQDFSMQEDLYYELQTAKDGLVAFFLLLYITLDLRSITEETICQKMIKACLALYKTETDVQTRSQRCMRDG